MSFSSKIQGRNTQGNHNQWRNSNPTSYWFSIKVKIIGIEMQVKTMRYCSIPIRLTKSMVKMPNFAKDIDPQNLLLTAGGSINWYNYFGKTVQIIRGHSHSLYPSNFSQEEFLHVSRNFHNHPSRGKCVNKKWYPHILDCYKAMNISPPTPKSYTVHILFFIRLKNGLNEK